MVHTSFLHESFSKLNLKATEEPRPDSLHSSYLETLPKEILDMVFEYMQPEDRDSKFTSSHTLYYNAALASRALYRALKSQLCHSVTVHMCGNLEHRFRHLIHALRMGKAQLIRRIQLLHCQRHGTSLGVEDGFHFAEALSNATNLRDFRSFPAPFSTVAFSIINQYLENCTQLTSLCVFAFDLDIFCQLLNRILNLTIEVSEFAPPDPLPATNALRSMRLILRDNWSCSAVCVVDLNRAPQLQYLSIESCSQSGKSVLVLDGESRSIRTVRVRRMRAEDVSSILSRCWPEFTHFDIDCNPVESVVPFHEAEKLA